MMSMPLVRGGPRGHWPSRGRCIKHCGSGALLKDLSWKGSELVLIENIRRLNVGTVIPKPQATGDFLIKGWGTRRGQPALLYLIPNHKSPDRPLVKGIAIAEFECAHAQLVKTGELTRVWFNSSLPACAKEGSCNFTTIGGIFCLLDVADYEGRGIYRTKAKSLTLYAVGNPQPGPGPKLHAEQDLDAMFDELAEEMAEREAAKAEAGPGSRPSVCPDNDFAAILTEIFVEAGES
jgi:hypothetical protein